VFAVVVVVVAIVEVYDHPLLVPATKIPFAEP